MGAGFLKARVKRETIPSLYRVIAPFHDGLALVVERNARKKLLEFADVRDGQDILEVAVGTGLSFKEVVEQNPNGTSTAVDVTDAMLRKTSRRIRSSVSDRVRIQFGDAYDLPFPDNSFDRLINSYMLDMIPRESFATILGEFYRVLRPGGKVALAYMVPGQSYPEKLWDDLYRLHPFILGGCRGVDILPYISQCGFKNVRSERITQLTFPSEVVVACVPDH